MIKYVIPMILPEENACYIPLDLLEMMASCSSGIILNYIAHYFKDACNINSPAYNKIKAAYSSVFARNEYLQSMEVKNMVRDLNNLTIFDISPNKSVEQLLMWREYITEALTNDYASPIIEPITKDKLADFIDAMDTYVNEANCVNPISLRAVTELKNTVEKNKNLFKDAPFKTNNSTILKGVFIRKDEFELILYGIDFLVPKLQSGINYKKWRKL